LSILLGLLYFKFSLRSQKKYVINGEKTTALYVEQLISVSFISSWR